MASLGNPKLWVPYMNTKDCSQGFCSLYCPQWCYVIYPPPPPPPPFGFPDDDSRPNFSPLVIAIIALLATAFLLVSYYAVIRKYFRKNESRRNQNHNPDGGLQENHDPPFSSSSSVLHEPWHFVSTSNGLDEALIKSITVCKYKKGDGLVEGTDCSVCLSEFEEDEMLRLLPKCSHAFHLTCIDTWLKSHSNCPLCRASIVCGNASPTPSRLPLPVAETPQLDRESSSESEQHQNENLGIAEHPERNNGGEEENQSCDNVVSKSPLRVFSDLGNMERRETVIEIIGEVGDQQTRRSVSMDYSRQVPSIADMLLLNQDEDTRMDEIDDGSSSGESSSQSWHRNKGVLLHYVMNPVTMKRSFSSGKFFFKKHGRGRDPITPFF